MHLLSRQLAARSGLKRYYTGRSCRKGHDSERYVSTGNCIECMRAPIGMMVRVSVDIHQDDRRDLEAYAAALCMARGVAPAAASRVMSQDEMGYWHMINNLRKGGCPEDQIGNFRTYKTFTLPEGQNP